MADARAWLERVLSDEKTVFFVLELKERGDFIGTVSLHSLYFKNQNAELAILIGEPENQGRGLGGEALSAFLDHAFGELGLYRVLAYNEPAIRLYRRLGFREEGRPRAQVWREGAWHDVLVFGLLRDEWRTQAPGPDKRFRGPLSGPLLPGACSAYHQRTSKRSSSITLAQALTKSRTNAAPASSAA